MMRSLFIALLTFFSLSMLGQGSYAPPANESGTLAIHKDSAVFVAWATHAIIERGWQDIADESLGKTSVGDEFSATEKSGVNGVVSLGDGGTATLTFEGTIFNGTGADFAVFENGFDTFLELAFVEVSSDGVNFFRFPAYSETPTETQVGSFGAVDATNIHNLAGKYVSQYGTPFDLEDLAGINGLNIDAITHIRVVDAIGTINPTFSTYDALGRAVNDPYPTAFASGGFDLDAVGVIHLTPTGIDENNQEMTQVYPNPFQNVLNFTFTNEDKSNCVIYNQVGKIVYQNTFNSKQVVVNTDDLPSGVYFVELTTNKNKAIKKLIKY
jgi:hypothetical protein